MYRLKMVMLSIIVLLIVLAILGCIVVDPWLGVVILIICIIYCFVVRKKW